MVWGVVHRQEFSELKIPYDTVIAAYFAGNFEKTLEVKLTLGAMIYSEECVFNRKTIDKKENH